MSRTERRPAQTRLADTQVAFGPLTLAYTAAFTPTWNDGGSGADNDGAFYMPAAPDGFRPLGGLGQSGYDDPNSQVAVLCVRASDGFPTALASPDHYEQIWGDWGSGADQDGSCWRPVPPPNYVALGDVFVNGYSPPSVDAIWCVHQDYVWDGVVSEWIWDDSGSGADTDFSAWTVAPMSVFIDNDNILIAPGTFVGTASHDKPALPVKVLRLPPPVVTNGVPPVPTLDSFDRPPDESTLQWDHRVTVPFTAVTDDQYGLAWKVANSPFYVLERWVNYKLELYDNNQQSAPHTIETEVTVGVTEQETETFSHEAGISISYESGVSFGVKAKVTGTLSYKFGYSSSTSVSAFQQKTVKMQLVTPGGHAAAMWAPRTMFQLVRADGSKVSEPLALEDNAVAFYEREFPPPSGGPAKPRRRPLR